MDCKSWVIILAVSFFFQSASPCTTVVVGKDASADGSVLFGHNEDDGGRRVVNVWRVSRKQHALTDSITLVSGIRIPQVKQTWAYLWFQMNGLKYSDCYMNEWGVTLASNACPSRCDSLTAGRGVIGFMLRRILAERAQSAREAVRLAGALVDSLGYEDYGRTLIVCDPNEGWILSLLGGKYWAAQRVPDKGAAVIANQYIFDQIDFKDNKNWIFSTADIRQLAADNGWKENNGSSKFNFSKIFSDAYTPDLRQWRGQQLICGLKDTVMNSGAPSLPAIVYPKKKVQLTDIAVLLRDHYEGTRYELNLVPDTDLPGRMMFPDADLASVLNPNVNSHRPICVLKTQYSVAAQLRNWLPWPASGLLWVSFGRPDCHPYLPWYAGLDSIPDVYRTTDIDDPEIALKRHFDQSEDIFEYNPRTAYWIQNELENVVDLNYPTHIQAIQVKRTMIENRLMEFQKDFEKGMLRVWKNNPESAALYCRELLKSATSEALQESKLQIKKIKTREFH